MIVIRRVLRRCKSASQRAYPAILSGNYPAEWRGLWGSIMSNWRCMHVKSIFGSLYVHINAPIFSTMIFFDALWEQ
jgi:hypothetical protein